MSIFIDKRLRQLPRHAMTHEEVESYAKQLKISHFRGVFMRNELPKAPWKEERAMMNLDDDAGPGTHFVAYVKQGSTVWYFDSYGNLPPPIELLRYLGNRVKIFYNVNRQQTFDSQECGRLSLHFLYKRSR